MFFWFNFIKIQNYGTFFNGYATISRDRVQNTADVNGSTSDEGDKSENPADILINSYKGAIEFLFEIGTWLTYLDEEVKSTRSIIESAVMESILQNYDRNKAIKCLTEENVSVSCSNRDFFESMSSLQ